MASNYPPMATRDIRHAAIRQALKEAFPATRFGVNGSRGTGYGWSRVVWVDGPTEARLRPLVARFFGSEFNGMTDSYDATNNYFDYKGVTYAAGGDGFHLNRTYSERFLARIIEEVGARYNAPTHEWPTVYQFKAAATDTISPLVLSEPRWQGLHYWSWSAIIRRAAEDRTTLAN